MNSWLKRSTGYYRVGPGEQELLPWCIWVSHPPSRQMCSPIQKLSKLCTFEIIMEASSCRCAQSLTQSPALSFPGDEGWGWKFQPSNHRLVYLMTSPTLKLSSSPPRVTSSAQKTLTPSLRRDLGAQCQMLPSLGITKIFRALCQVQVRD